MAAKNYVRTQTVFFPISEVSTSGVTLVHPQVYGLTE